MKIGIRDLKGRAPQVVREVRETGEPAEITYRGEVVAYLTPVEPQQRAADYSSAWKEFDQVVRAIGKRTNRQKTQKTPNWRRNL